MILAFVLFLLLFAGVGVASIVRSRKTSEDYVIASRDVPPWLVALSSVATNNSGFMFIGLIGFTYQVGLAALWLQLGWLVGDLLAWMWFHRRVREVSGELKIATIPGLLGAGPDGPQAGVTRLAATVAILLMVTYAAAQLAAGSKALVVLFGWELWVGATLGAIIVLLYSFAGGLRASIWTDATQAFVMLAAMLALLVAGLGAVGGLDGLADGLRAEDTALMQLFPDDLDLGVGLWLLGFVFAGFGVIGQPHIVVRTMAIRSADQIPRARRVYFAWFVPFSICAILVGLTARVLLPDPLTFDAELALPRLAVDLLPGVFVGFILAGLFAATMSTADSLIIACSASLTRDLAPRFDDRPKWATAGATLIALALAVWGPESVFVLVLVAWSGMASGFGPLLILRLAHVRVGGGLAVAMLVAGFGTSIVWRFALGWHDDVLEILPGFVAGFLTFAAGRLIARAGDRARPRST